MFEREFSLFNLCRIYSGGFMKNGILIVILVTLLMADRNAMMVNFSPVTDWNTESVFRDEFKMSRDWIAQHVDSSWGKGGELSRDSLGWVTSFNDGQYAETVIFTEGERNVDGGDFVLLYDGEGEIEIRNTTVTKKEAGRIEVTLNPGQQVFIRVLSVNEDNYIRNIHFVRVADEETFRDEPFHQQFIDRWSGYFGIRYMPWMHTNDAACSTWADRTVPQSNTQTDKRGVALEYMIHYANITNTHPWFSLNHNVDDEYIRKFAEMVRDSLNPELKIYIEYSNEVWNTVFKAYRWCSNKGLALGIGSDEYRAALHFQAKRSIEMFKIWEEVFGGTERLVRVIASHGENHWSGEQVLKYDDAYKMTDVFAIAPYFGGYLGNPDTQEDVATWSLDRLFDTLTHVVKYEDRDQMQDNMDMLKTKFGDRDIRLTVYEGGQHMVGYNGAEHNPDLEELFKKANRDQRMREVYMTYLNHWKEIGGAEFAIFISIERYSKWGSWGLKERETDTDEDSPKYMAMLDFIAENPIWWDNSPIVSENGVKAEDSDPVKLTQNMHGLTLDLHGLTSGNFKLFDTRGRLMMRRSFGETNNQITIDDMASGMYLMSIESPVIKLNRKVEVR